MDNIKTCAQYGIFVCGCCVNTNNNKNCKIYKPTDSKPASNELIYGPRPLAINYVKECKVENEIIKEFEDLKENTTKESCANLGNILNSPSTSNTLTSNESAINSEHKPERSLNNNSTSNRFMEFILSSPDNKELKEILEIEDNFWKDIAYESQFLNANNSLQETIKEEKLAMSICPTNSICDDENVLNQAKSKLEDTPIETVFDSERKNTSKIEDSKNEILKTSNLTNSSGTSDEIDILNIPDLANFILKNVALDKVVNSSSQDVSKLDEPTQKVSNLVNSPSTSEEINFINIPEFEEFIARNLPFAVRDNNYSDGDVETNSEMNIPPKIEEFKPPKEIWNLIDLPSTSKQMSNMPDILEDLIVKNMSAGVAPSIDQKLHKMLSNPYVNSIAHINKKLLSKIDERRNKRRKTTQNYEAENEAVIFVGAYSNTARSAEHNVVIEISDSPTRVPIIDEVICLSDNENEKDERDSRLGECPVCLENFSTKDIMSTICGHIFCAECIKSVIKTTRKCPKCRKRLSLKKIHPLFI